MFQSSLVKIRPLKTKAFTFGGWNAYEFLAVAVAEYLLMCIISKTWTVRRWTLAKKLVRDASNMHGNLERFSWFLDLEIECVGDCWSLFKVNRGILKGSALKDGDEAKLDTLHRSLNLKSFFISAVITPTGGHWVLGLFDVSHQECFALVFAPMVIIMWHRRLIVILWEPCKIERTKWLSHGYCILRPCFLVGFCEWGGDPLCKGQAGMYHWIAGKIEQAPKFHVIWKWLKGLSIKKLAILVQSHICHIHACDRMWYSPIFVVRSGFYSWSPVTCDVFVPFTSQLLSLWGSFTLCVSSRCCRAYSESLGSCRTRRKQQGLVTCHQVQLIMFNYSIYIVDMLQYASMQSLEIQIDQTWPNKFLHLVR